MEIPVFRAGFCTKLASEVRELEVLTCSHLTLVVYKSCHRLQSKPANPTRLTDDGLYLPTFIVHGRTCAGMGPSRHQVNGRDTYDLIG